MNPNPQDLTNAATEENQQTIQSKNVYLVAKENLGKHITEDENVPAELGCAEAVSFVLTKAGYDLTPQGIAGTADMYAWLKISAKFKEVTAPLPGDIIISPTGTSTLNSPHGHVGIVAEYGILSNNSETGLFLEVFDLTKWNTYFSQLGFPVFFFRPQ